MIYVPETIKSALSALALNKVRTFLTMLGVIIGVFSVVALVAVVQGFQNYITDQFESLGSNLILVTRKISQDHDPGRTFMGNRLSLKNVDTINLYVGDKISVVTPSIRIAKVADYKSKAYSGTVVGGNYQSYSVYGLETELGSYSTKADDSQKANEGFISSEVQQK